MKKRDEKYFFNVQIKRIHMYEMSSMCAYVSGPLILEYQSVRFWPLPCQTEQSGLPRNPITVTS